MILTFIFALLFAVTVMTAAWSVLKRSSHIGWVDVVWSFLMFALVVYAVFVGGGEALRKFYLLLIGGAWSLRLGFHILFQKTIGKPEEPRYAELKKAWGEDADFKLWRFLMYQAMGAAVLAIPFFAIASNPEESLRAIEIIGIGIWLVGFIGEVCADNQLARFKKSAAGSGKTCREGLWRYSRHPNYFFEWVMWVAYGMCASVSALGWWAYLFPVLMGYFLVFATGIPKAEEQALKSRGEDYRDYQSKTSAFIPWFPKKQKRKN